MRMDNHEAGVHTMRRDHTMESARGTTGKMDMQGMGVRYHGAGMDGKTMRAHMGEMNPTARYADAASHLHPMMRDGSRSELRKMAEGKPLSHEPEMRANRAEAKEYNPKVPAGRAGGAIRG